MRYSFSLIMQMNALEITLYTRKVAIYVVQSAIIRGQNTIFANQILESGVWPTEKTHWAP